MTVTKRALGMVDALALIHPAILPESRLLEQLQNLLPG